MNTKTNTDAKSVLLIGSGGRDHAIAWKLCQSPRLGKLYVAPGNAGTSKLFGCRERVENVQIEANNGHGLLAFAQTKHIDLTIVGPDEPLARGIVNMFHSYSLPIFGPTQAAARIESSKDFSKRLMTDAHVPTAEYRVFTDHADAHRWMRAEFCRRPAAVVIKASGLALGKGVYVCKTVTDAEHALRSIMIDRVHGSAGDTVIIEDFVEGSEVSIHAISDGKTHVTFPAAQDHKAAYDDDKGPNTGGMGAIAPLPWFNHYDIVDKQVVGPILAGLLGKGAPFTGMLFPGLIMTNTGPIAIECNARFGDPETQVYMRLLQSDLLEMLLACVEGKLEQTHVQWHPGYAACVVVASDGYPSPHYVKGVPIYGIEEAEKIPGIIVFHMGTEMRDGQLVTSGGRVLCVAARRPTLAQAIEAAYAGVACITFRGAHYRKDIGRKSLMLSGMM